MNAIEGTGKICPLCNEHMINLTSLDLRICCCGHKEAFVLEDGQKSVLEKGKVGGRKD